MQNLQTIDAGDALYRHAEVSELPEAHTLAQWFEPCMSCGRRFNRTATTITILCIEGRSEVVKVCASCKRRRKL